MRNRWTGTRIDYHPCITTKCASHPKKENSFLYLNKENSF